MMTNDTLKTCPFCDSEPSHEYLGGSCIDIECCYACISIQICDCMTIEERLSEPDLTVKNNFKHQPKYVERAKQEAIKAWNTRALDKDILEVMGPFFALYKEILEVLKPFAHLLEASKDLDDPTLDRISIELKYLRKAAELYERLKDKDAKV